jgi:ABC-type multidrug transport system permease subunit
MRESLSGAVDTERIEKVMALKRTGLIVILFVVVIQLLAARLCIGIPIRGSLIEFFVFLIRVSIFVVAVVGGAFGS